MARNLDNIVFAILDQSMALKRMPILVVITGLGLFSYPVNSTPTFYQICLSW